MPLNMALAAARDGVKVLVIDADCAAHTAISKKIDAPAKRETDHSGWLGIHSKVCRAIKTANQISILPSIGKSCTGHAIRKAITQARSAGEYDLLILDGPPMPFKGDNREVLEIADGLVAVLPANLDINDCMDGIVVALGGTQRKLIGVVINELHPATELTPPSKRYA